MALHHMRRLYVMAESTFGTDPDGTGASYKWVAGALELGALNINKQLIDANYVSDADVPSHSPVVGADSWKFDCKVALIGLSADAGDGGSPPADDWLDVILTQVFGTQTALAGEGVGAGSTTTDLVLDTDAYSEGDLVAIFDAAMSLSPNRVQWAYLDVDDSDGTYTPKPDFEEAVTTTGIAYGYNAYRLNPEYAGSLSFIYSYDGNEWGLHGGRCTSASIDLDAAGGIWTMSLTFEGDNVGNTSYSEPSAGGGAAQLTNTPVRGVGSPMWFNNAKLSSVKSVKIDLGVNAGFIPSTEAAEGRGAANIYTMMPSITVDPLYADSYLELQRAGTEGELLIQMGKGQAGATAGTTDSLCFYARNVYVSEASTVDDGGKIRNSLVFKPATQIRHSAATKENTIQLCRA